MNWRLSALMFAAIGCADAGNTSNKGPMFTTRDSAGVEIIEYSHIDTAQLERWVVGSEAFTSIGDDARGPDYRLNSVVGAALTSDGRIVVGDGNMVRMYNSAGSMIRLVAREGRGPGEFSDLSGLSVIRGDTLVAYQRYPEAMFVFAPNGDFLRSETLVRAMDRQAQAEFEAFAFAGFLDDGTIIAQRHPGERRKEPRGEILDSVRPLRLDRTGRVIADFGKWLSSRTQLIPAPPGATTKRPVTMAFPHNRSLWGIAGDQIYYTVRNDFEIRMFSAAGQLRRVIRIVSKPLLSKTLDSLRTDDREEHKLSFVRPDTVRPIRQLLGDREGNLWVTTQPHTVQGMEGQWVFDSTGRLRATFELPNLTSKGGGKIMVIPGSSIQRPSPVQQIQIRGDRVLVRTLDEYSVPQLLVLPLTRTKREE